MDKYSVTIIIERAWGQTYNEVIFKANTEEHAEELAENYLDKLEMRYDEDEWGEYEEAYIGDIVKIS